MKKPWRWILGAIAGVAAIRAAMVAVVRPSNTRDWAEDQRVLPVAEFNGPLVTIHNIRNFTYEAVDRYTPAWYDKTFDLRKLESAWFVVEPFGGAAMAHTFVSFGFGGNDFVAISVEIRKEKGESFSPIKGLLRQYEVMYVVGDERDLSQVADELSEGHGLPLSDAHLAGADAGDVHGDAAAREHARGAA